MADERDVLGRIRELVEAEHQLRERFGRGELSSDDEHAQLTSLEQQLDQCWDLLRQRRAPMAPICHPKVAYSRFSSEPT
jgi:Protein of unknown function (DUF2630)